MLGDVCPVEADVYQGVEIFSSQIRDYALRVVEARRTAVNDD